MTFLNYSQIWSICYFTPVCYGMLLTTLVLYLVPLTATQYNSLTTSYTQSNFKLISGHDVFYILFYTIVFFFILGQAWLSSSFSSWFGHLSITGFQLKLAYLVWAMFCLSYYIESTNAYFSSRDSFDSAITKISLVFWLSIIFLANSLITTIFVIEVMSALLFLLITTSVYSTTFYYRNVDFSSYNYFQNSMPYTFINSIIYFFWTSLISSLNLFLFTIYLYTTFLSLDWYLIEHIYSYYISVSASKDLFVVGIVWFIMIFSILLKCGIAPFFIWKPSFFKGLPMNTLFFYITVFYFSLFLFFIHFLSSYMFYFTDTYSYILFFVLLVGILVLISILFESFYIKSFMAVSSILNSLLVFLALSSSHGESILLFL